MGNTHNKGSEHRNAKQSTHTDREGQAYTSQFSLSHFVGNLSGRSFASVTSTQSVYSSSRPWSRVSRRRWNDATLKNPLEASKTAWPVAHKESIFLPEFPIAIDLLQKDFEIQENIAKGAFGEVYKVKKLSVNKEYSLKVLNKSKVISDNAVRQVKDETHIQEVCGHHTFIVGSVSRWQTKKRLYIKYIPGGELLSLLEKYRNLPEELVKLFTAEIAIALDFLHNAGVIYRDLKPENILLDANYHIQLIDFGLSKWLSIGSRTTTLCGTLKYMAPEILSREPYGHAVDWWSLGVLACRMLTDELNVNLVADDLKKADDACLLHATGLRNKSKFPTPAIDATARCDGGASSYTTQNHDAPGTMDLHNMRLSADKKQNLHQPVPGTLPNCASSLSKSARGLLMRLLERDPRQRIRSLRQMQQSAFYMGFNFDHVRAMKVSPRLLLEGYFPDDSAKDCQDTTCDQDFPLFDQAAII